jgi:hypothetical protein
MLDLILLFGLIVFVVVVNRFFKTTAEEQHRVNAQRNRKNLFIAVPFAIAFLSACGDHNRNSNVDSSMIDSTSVTYQPYMTQEDFDSIKDAMPDSVGIVLSRNEYQGMRLFMMNCNKCHPGGEKGFGPSLIDKNLPDFLIHFQVRNGLGDMPAFTKEQLPKEDVKKIVLFIHALHDDYKDYQSNPNY